MANLQHNISPVIANLSKWTELAKNGGIATGVAKTDHIAQPGELMFLEGDKIVLLSSLEHPNLRQQCPSTQPNETQFLAFCEGVVGLISLKDILLDHPLSPSSQPAIRDSNSQPCLPKPSDSLPAVNQSFAQQPCSHSSPKSPSVGFNYPRRPSSKHSPLGVTKPLLINKSHPHRRSHSNHHPSPATLSTSAPRPTLTLSQHFRSESDLKRRHPPPPNSLPSSPTSTCLLHLDRQPPRHCHLDQTVSPQSTDLSAMNSQLGSRSTLLPEPPSLTCRPQRHSSLLHMSSAGKLVAQLPPAAVEPVMRTTTLCPSTSSTARPPTQSSPTSPHPSQLCPSSYPNTPLPSTPVGRSPFPGPAPSRLSSFDPRAQEPSRQTRIFTLGPALPIDDGSSMPSPSCAVLPSKPSFPVPQPRCSRETGLSVAEAELQSATENFEHPSPTDLCSFSTVVCPPSSTCSSVSTCTTKSSSIATSALLSPPHSQPSSPTAVTIKNSPCLQSGLPSSQSAAQLNASAAPLAEGRNQKPLPKSSTAPLPLSGLQECPTGDTPFCSLSEGFKDLSRPPGSSQPATRTTPPASVRPSRASSLWSSRRLLPLKIEPFGKKASPSARVLNISTPTLVLHTNADMAATIGIPATPHHPHLLESVARAQQIPTAELPADLGGYAKPSGIVIAAYSPSNNGVLTPASSSASSSPPDSATKRCDSLLLCSFPAVPRTAPLGPTSHTLAAPSKGDMNRAHTAPSTPALANTPCSAQFPPGVAVGSDDFRPALVTVKGGPAFQLVKPHIEWLQAIAAEEEQEEAVCELSDERGGSRELFASHRMMSNVSQTSMGTGSCARLVSEDEVEQGEGWGRSAPRRRTRTTSELRIWRGLKDEMDEYGLLRDERGGGEDCRVKESKWLAMMSGVAASEARVNKKVQKLVLMGGAIPASLRGRVWGWLLNVEEHRVRGVWEKLASKERGMVRVFADIEDGLVRLAADGHLGSPVARAEDVKGDLRKVLRAFVHFGLQLESSRRISGYRSEIGRLAAVLLSQAPAEDVFWILVGMVTRLLPGLWADEGDKCIGTLFQVHDELLHEMDPVVARHLASHELRAKIYRRQGFQELFINDMSQTSWLRVMDLVMLQGFKGMMNISLSFVKVRRHSILSTASREKLVSILKADSSGSCQGLDEELEYGEKDEVTGRGQGLSTGMKGARSEVEEEMVRWCEGSKIKSSGWVGKLLLA